MLAPHETSQPGVAHTNSKIERCNQIVLGGTISSLIEAGLPPCYWSNAALCFCVNYNISVWNGKSPWRTLWNHPFPGTAFPFGCLVYVKDMVSRRNTLARKWDPKGALGIFAGYKLHTGYAWKGEYLVWELDSFQSSDLRTVATNYHQGVGVPHVTKVCSLPTKGLVFR